MAVESAPNTETKPKTGIRVVIVGAGFRGLTAAIECHLQGHDVVVVEAFPALKPLGDIISFGSNAGHIFHSWSDGYISRKFRPLCIDVKHFDLRKYDGEKIIQQKSLVQIHDWPVFNGHRGELHMIVFYYAKDVLGIPIRLGSKVTEYFEDASGAGVVLESGEKVTGDVVIGSDGVRSKARELVLGYLDKPRSSGYAVFRAWVTTEKILEDPVTREFVANGDSFTGWIGQDVHFLVAVLKDGKDISWVLTHKDEVDIDESWSYPGKLKDALKVVKGWDPTCAAIIEKAPQAGLVDWKLVYRDPLPTWISKEARTALLGDSAHPFLPTSVQGASQAMEDGVTLGVCLRKAGKDKVPLGLRVYERIRYDRVRRVQKTGESTRDMWHKADWDAVKKDPTKVQLPRDDWILKHHCRQYAEDNFNRVAEEIREGRLLKDFDDTEHLKKMTLESVKDPGVAA